MRECACRWQHASVTTETPPIAVGPQKYAFVARARHKTRLPRCMSASPAASTEQQATPPKPRPGDSHLRSQRLAKGRSPHITRHDFARCDFDLTTSFSAATAGANFTSSQLHQKPSQTWRGCRRGQRGPKLALRHRKSCNATRQPQPQTLPTTISPRLFTALPRQLIIVRTPRLTHSHMRTCGST